MFKSVESSEVISSLPFECVLRKLSNLLISKGKISSKASEAPAQGLFSTLFATGQIEEAPAPILTKDNLPCFIQKISLFESRNTQLSKRAPMKESQKDREVRPKPPPKIFSSFRSFYLCVSSLPLLRPYLTTSDYQDELVAIEKLTLNSDTTSIDKYHREICMVLHNLDVLSDHKIEEWTETLTFMRKLQSLFERDHSICGFSESQSEADIEFFFVMLLVMIGRISNRNQSLPSEHMKKFDELTAYKALDIVQRLKLILLGSTNINRSIDAGGLSNFHLNEIGLSGRISSMSLKMDRVSSSKMTKTIVFSGPYLRYDLTIWLEKVAYSKLTFNDLIQHLKETQVWPYADMYDIFVRFSKGSWKKITLCEMIKSYYETNYEYHIVPRDQEFQDEFEINSEYHLINKIDNSPGTPFYLRAGVDSKEGESVLSSPFVDLLEKIWGRMPPEFKLANPFADKLQYRHQYLHNFKTEVPLMRVGSEYHSEENKWIDKNYIQKIETSLRNQHDHPKLLWVQLTDLSSSHVFKVIERAQQYPANSQNKQRYVLNLIRFVNADIRTMVNHQRARIYSQAPLVFLEDESIGKPVKLRAKLAEIESKFKQVNCSILFSLAETTQD